MTVKDGTYKLENGEFAPFVPTHGYIVGLADFKIVVELKATSTQLVTDLLERYRLLALRTNYYISVWTNPDTKMAFFNLSIHTEDYNYALKKANEGNQEYVWDVENERCIRVRDAAYRGVYSKDGVSYRGFSSLSIVDALNQAKGMASRALNRLIA